MWEEGGVRFIRLKSQIGKIAFRNPPNSPMTLSIDSFVSKTHFYNTKVWIYNMCKNTQFLIEYTWKYSCLAHLREKADHAWSDLWKLNATPLFESPPPPHIPCSILSLRLWQVPHCFIAVCLRVCHPRWCDGSIMLSSLSSKGWAQRLSHHT